MAPAKILVVDDDPAIRNLVFRFLGRYGYELEQAPDGETGMNKFKQFSPDLVILDVNLPDALGYNLCQEMQKIVDVLVLMLTSRADMEDKIIGFEKGADDYLTKPFNVEELKYRVEALLKRQRTAGVRNSQLITHGDLSIDPERREVTLQGIEINLTALEFDLLQVLASNPEKVLRRSELISAVWDYEHQGDQRVVDVHIGQIRKKLEADGVNRFIKTVRGVGYKFEPPASEAQSE
ncbi:response regulator transcription factor [Roseofilum casamattae]|uniref:Response regulator transcription factor n=1 Tax=Roseofilum casamattae BLCC-M143 TaxID=3022442 RepID=A0ABT7BRF0_9CYAN|nr:response regulator transcription factor [Roseofilum casamattae]MDJ1181770.1 response regulator transcription factor [Roseofilum casamattae BLCC-M143]